jgi:hypothetical protein
MAGRLVFTLAAGWLLLAGTAPAAVRPADGDWQASNTFGPWAEVVSFTVEGNGTRITNTNGLVGNPTSCGPRRSVGGAGRGPNLRWLVRDPRQRSG